MTKNYYDILGVNKNASLEQIKDAYIQRSLETHPANNKDGSKGKYSFKEVSEAYQILSDQQKRYEYDNP